MKDRKFPGERYESRAESCVYLHSGTRIQCFLNFKKRLNPKKKREKTYRIKTNNQELLIRKQNESDATS